MEHTSDLVYEGKLIHEFSYNQRNEKHSELEIEVAFQCHVLKGVIDFYNSKEKTIHETKKSDTIEEAHIWQIKYYLWLLKCSGVIGAKGKIEFPLLKKTESVFLNERDEEFLKITISDIEKIFGSNAVPGVLNGKICKKCSYYEFCYSGSDV